MNVDVIDPKKTAMIVVDGVSFCRTRRLLMTIRTEDLGRWRMRMSTTPRW